STNYYTGYFFNVTYSGDSYVLQIYNLLESDSPIAFSTLHFDSSLHVINPTPLNVGAKTVIPLPSVMGIITHEIDIPDVMMNVYLYNSSHDAATLTDLNNGQIFISVNFPVSITFSSDITIENEYLVEAITMLSLWAAQPNYAVSPSSTTPPSAKYISATSPDTLILKYGQYIMIQTFSKGVLFFS
ncbi:MAG: hypothetical protein EBV19_09450, partial [Flavobacteriia bacterium]|nr:hypothetical protein [Flavobacteriia bacterium]